MAHVRLSTGSWTHAFAFAGFAIVPAAFTGLLGLGEAPESAEPRPAVAAIAEIEPATLHAEAPPPPTATEALPAAEPLAPAATVDEALQPSTPPAATASEAPEPLAERRAEGRLQRGQTIAQALRGHGVDAAQVHELVSSMRPVYDFRRAPAGARYDLAWAESGERLTSFCFRPDEITSYEATRSDDGNLAVREVRPDLRVVEHEVVARIESSLYQAISDAGESAALASKIGDVFAWDLDFSRDQHRGDEFRMIVEKRYRGESFIDYGRVIAAEYAGKRGTYRAFWFSPDGPDGKGHFYLEDGRSAEKTFLASPVEYTRVSSRFNKKRKHPILGFTKAHNGTDFAAPRGTPVRAMADGVVTFAGRKGPSGKLVVIDHQNGLKTYYAHLNSFAKGMRKGKRVSQKQLIGRVGTTGRSTGPHLHLGVKRNGRWMDPQRLKIRRSEPIPPAQLPAFRALAAEQQLRLAALKLPAEVDTEVASTETRTAALQVAALNKAGGL
jgi:murein DD-endopeptidase MepM/ murein hydrolase activator NlpD